MKDIEGLKGLRGLKTLQGLKKRSMSQFESSTYISIYMLTQERKRLLKEDERLVNRMATIRKRVTEIDLEIQQLKENITATESSENEKFLGKQQPAQEHDGKKEWKTMPLAY
jgi:predicted nuclease with TOPRIM domain